jgi:hypothetical protein
MKLALRTLAIFLLSLLIADQGSNVLLNAARRQYLAHLDRGAWWPAVGAALEGTEFIVYVLVFGLVGTVFARLFEQRLFATVLALLLGAGYSVLAFVFEPDLPFARYSHAPIWLWVLSWSSFYVPTIAALLGVISSPTNREARASTQNAA